MKPVPLSPDEMERKLKQRLCTGWVVVTGDVEAISRLENTFFTPGTPKNTDFELMILPITRGVGVQYLFLAKKQRLKELKIPDLERTFELHYASLNENTAVVQQTIAKDGEPKQVDTYVRNLLTKLR